MFNDILCDKLCDFRILYWDSVNQLSMRHCPSMCEDLVVFQEQHVVQSSWRSVIFSKPFKPLFTISYILVSILAKAWMKP